MRQDNGTVKIAEHRLVLVEQIVDGKLQITCEMAGDGVAKTEADPEAQVSTGYLLLATMFQLFTDGTVFTEMHKRFGHAPRAVEINVEENAHA